MYLFTDGQLDSLRVTGEQCTRLLGKLTFYQEFLASSESIQVTSQLYHNYSRNVAYNLEALKKLPKPQ